MRTATRTEALPSNGWGDATFHLANAERSLEAAVRRAVSVHERELATRMRSALQKARAHTLARAYERAGEAGDGAAMTTARVAPFVFVAATRYAIDRLWTGASQDMAGQVLAHVDVIRRDRGCANAIVRAVEEWIACGDDRGQPGVTPREIAAAERRWLEAVAALTCAPIEGGFRA